MKTSKYSTIQEYAKAFANKNLGLVILAGRAGTGKSQTFKQAMGRHVCWIEGNASAFGLYRKLYEYRDTPVVLDDVDGLTKDRNAVRLMKSLCQTDPVKTVQWKTKAAGTKDLPDEFRTSSHVCIICNDWQAIDKNAQALTDRGHFIEFEPTSKAVHQQARKWFKNNMIYRWFGRHLERLPSLSMRDYVRCDELFKAGMDWKQPIIDGLSEDVRAEIRELDELKDRETLNRYVPILRHLKNNVQHYADKGRFERAGKLYSRCQSLVKPAYDNLHN